MPERNDLIKKGYMIFDVDNGNFNHTESYKERNLYYKILADYLFNELMRGEEQRKTDFLQLLADTLNNPERFRGNKEEMLMMIRALK